MALINAMPQNGGGAVTKLWENDSPSATTFSSQSITLDSSDYDFLMFVVKRWVNTDAYTSFITPKGHGAELSISSPESNGSRCSSRIATWVNDTKYTFGDCYVSTGTTASSLQNNSVIPLYVYGIKY